MLFSIIHRFKNVIVMFKLYNILSILYNDNKKQWKKTTKN